MDPTEGQRLLLELFGTTDLIEIMEFPETGDPNRNTPDLQKQKSPQENSPESDSL